MNAGAGSGGKNRQTPFLYPTRPVPKTAVLSPWFGTGTASFGSGLRAAVARVLTASSQPDRAAYKAWGIAKTYGQQIRIFPQGWTEETDRFAPASVAGTFDQLIALKPSAIASLTHALIVLGSPDVPQLTEQRRDRLWQIFGLPVFEQVIGPSGRLLATECEMHQGLHIESPDFRLPHRSVWGIVETSEGICPCGRSTPRVSIRIPQRLAAGAG